MFSCPRSNIPAYPPHTPLLTFYNPHLLPTLSYLLSYFFEQLHPYSSAYTFLPTLPYPHSLTRKHSHIHLGHCRCPLTYNNTPPPCPQASMTTPPLPKSTVLRTDSPGTKLLFPGDSF